MKQIGGPAHGAVSRAEGVAEALQAEILERGLVSGDFLGLRSDLIERFGVSPASINEALRILRERQMVTVKPGRSGGVHVASVPPSIRLGVIDVYFRGVNLDARELFEARALMEDMLAHLAVVRATDDDLVAIDEALAAMTAARNEGRAYLIANWKLHAAIAHAAHSTVLSGLYEAIIALISGSIVRVVVPDPGRYPAAITKNLKHHRDLVNAIRRRDAAALTDACRRHTADTHRRRLGAVAAG